MIDMLRGFNRQALHAVQLELSHPITGEWLSWKAPLPEDFRQLLDVLKQDKALHGSEQD
jgi:23S rRNA pseudouridine1911/1915/1917 synthase